MDLKQGNRKISGSANDRFLKLKSNYLHNEDDLEYKFNHKLKTNYLKKQQLLHILPEEKEVDETDNTHLSLVLIKIRKGIGIKHKYCFVCKQLTSVYNKHLHISHLV